MYYNLAITMTLLLLFTTIAYTLPQSTTSVYTIEACVPILGNAAVADMSV